MRVKKQKYVWCQRDVLNRQGRLYTFSKELLETSWNQSRPVVSWLALVIVYIYISLAISLDDYLAVCNMFGILTLETQYQFLLYPLSNINGGFTFVRFTCSSAWAPNLLSPWGASGFSRLLLCNQFSDWIRVVIYYIFSKQTKQTTTRTTKRVKILNEIVQVSAIWLLQQNLCKYYTSLLHPSTNNFLYMNWF